MSRLIVISNRVNPPADPGIASAGGLAMAISAALRNDNGIWFGWSGQIAETFTGQMSIQRIGGVQVALMDLEEQDVQEYYNGYANKTLWPLFHYRTDLAAFERSFDEGFTRVNERFAQTVFPLIEPDDLIWVHDYHLIPLARHLRRLGIRNRIGFFLHIPWPSRHVLTALPGHRDLVEAIFDYDLVGFQTLDSVTAFKNYVMDEADGQEPMPGKLRAFGKTLCADAFPIGIDAKDFEQASKSERAQFYCQRMRASQLGRKMIVGVDRLDYSKGLEERFLAYEQFLNDHPQRHEDVFFLQIATLSRDTLEAYQDIRVRLEMLSGKVNGNFSTVDWVPLRYVNHSHRRDELAGIYRAAHVGLVTPLRDGMNLVAKEYVAAQDPDDPGVLILSEFAGAAAQMQAALIVNPFDREQVADAIHKALDMPLAERKQRYNALIKDIRNDDVISWRERFVAALKAIPRPQRNAMLTRVS